MDRLLGLIASGLVEGVVLSAMAIAIVLIWRSTRVLNFAQGVMAVASVYFAQWIYQLTGQVWLTIPAAIVGGMVLGFVIERGIIRFLDTRHHMSAIIVTFGLMSLLHAVLGIIYGPEYGAFPTLLSDNALAPGFSVSWNDLLSAGIVVVALGVVTWMYRATPLGLRMRAAAFNPGTARLLGVRVPRVLTTGWMLASAVGAIAGLLIIPSGFGLNAHSLDNVLLSAFVAAVIGGLESPVGAVVGSLVLGVLLTLTSGLLGAEWVPIVSFIALTAVLLVRPQGLFAIKGGRRV